MITHTTAVHNTATDTITALISTGGKLILRLTGTAGSPGIAVATLSLASTPFGAASAGVATAGAITGDTNATGNASAVATATIETSGGTVIIHAQVSAAIAPTITGTSGAATVTVGSATGLEVGMAASGTGIATGAKIVHITGTTVTLSIPNSGAVSGSGLFSHDIAMTNGLVVGAGDTVNCSSLTYKALGA